MILLAPEQHHPYFYVDNMMCIKSHELLLDSYLNFDIGAEAVPNFRNRRLKLLSLLVGNTSILDESLWTAPNQHRVSIRVLQNSFY